jgi:NAD-dependent deacetylase
MTAADPAQLARAREALAAARSVFVLSGSGISAESGIPTFRGAGGYWRTLRFEDLASPAGFARDPLLVWTWYNERIVGHLDARPNAGHTALAQLEATMPTFTLATQNVDSLHQRGGSRNVLELHGHLREARCTGCTARRALDGALPLDEIEHECGGRWRPDIVWFGEALPAAIWEAAAEAAASADVVIVVGTSGLVYPAAALATSIPHAEAIVIEVNPEPTPVSSRAHVVLRTSAADALPTLVA